MSSGRSFASALAQRPLFFEPVPPSARASAARTSTYTEEVVRLLASVPRADAADVPELVDENHEGRPYYRSGDTREYARTLGDRSGREVVLNKVVAHLVSPAGVDSWTRETVARGLRNLVLVGGSSRYIPYPGPTVSEADRICRPIVEAAGGHLGNIAIPQRTGEPHRMLAKTRAGAQFFTTQILFDGELALKMITEYQLLCRQAGIAPSAVVLSVAPIADEGDAEFVRWLGAEIPEGAERAILNGEEASAGARSIEWALGLWRSVSRGARAQDVEVPIGINVEQVTPRHVGTAAEMLSAFARVIDADVGG